MLGCMSGTSIDGVDVAAIQTNGETISEFGPTAYQAYSEEERYLIRSAFGEWPSGSGVTAAETVVRKAHTEMIGEFSAPELIGFHGQTLAHDPQNRRTHQVGDGQILATSVKCPVVWDFRTADINTGGQGAPLTPFYHFALARKARIAEPVAFLNLGGAGNLTWVNPSSDRPETPGALAAFDTGPANGLINDLIAERTGMAFDPDGELALAGKISYATAQGLLNASYFDLPPPKSIDRNQFASLHAQLSHLDTEDAIATATFFVAMAVIRGLEFLPTKPGIIAVCGGGRKNTAILRWIAGRFEGDVVPVEHFGWNGDMLEAQAFGFLAARVVRGLPTSAPSTTGCRTPVVGGRISLPE